MNGSIEENLKKIKQIFVTYERELCVAIFVIFIPLFILGIARMSLIEAQKSPVRVFMGQTTNNVGIIGPQEAGLLVGSKNSTKYHYPWCSGAQRIKDSNKVWFSSEKEARDRGYTPAGNCPGL